VILGENIYISYIKEKLGKKKSKISPFALGTFQGKTPP
jgi:hypothetical protein